MSNSDFWKNYKERKLIFNNKPYYGFNPEKLEEQKRRDEERAREAAKYCKTQ